MDQTDQDSPTRNMTNFQLGLSNKQSTQIRHSSPDLIEAFFPPERNIVAEQHQILERNFNT